MRKLPAILAVTVFLSLIGCRSTPDNVLTPDEMADLLVDIHHAEAIADVQYSRYSPDTMRAALRQSVYDRHGITQADFDTSLAWYGHHIEKYIDLYDVVIERLEKQVEQAGSYKGAGGFLSGDSVDAWDGSSHYVLTRRSPAHYLDFNIPRDDNWRNGDSYTWQFKVFNRLSPMEVGVFVDYGDGSTDYMTSTVEQDGWFRTTVALDSLRDPQSVYGYIFVEPRTDEEIYIDSLSLIRKRFVEPTYQRRYQQRRFKYGKR